MRFALFLAPIALLAAACTPNNRTAFGYADYDGYDGYSSAEVSMRMEGDMAYTQPFDDQSRSGFYSSYGDGWFDMNVEAYGSYGWVMLIVSGDEDSDYREVIGCSGPDDGYADFDEPAVASTVEMTETTIDGQPAMQIFIEATFSDGGTAIAEGYALQ